MLARHSLLLRYRDFSGSFGDTTGAWRFLYGSAAVGRLNLGFGLGIEMRCGVMRTAKARDRDICALFEVVP